MEQSLKSEFVCEHCQRKFQRETSLTVHVCEPKRRLQEKNERGVQVGFQAFLKFYETYQGSAKLKTFDDFIASPYYRAFVKFGRHVVSINAIAPERFIEWLLKNNKKIDQWCRDSYYGSYLEFYLQTEPVDDALARSIEYGIRWGQEHTMQPQDVLRYGNHNRIVYAITTGRISPWAIYNSESGRKFLDDLDQHQLLTVWNFINPDIWKKKFSDYVADSEYAQEMLKNAGW
jgi:hypothetical protein